MGARTSIAGAMGCALLASGCSASVSLSRPDAERLRRGPEIPVVHRRSPEPWVDCQGDEGRQLWMYGGTARLSRPPSTDERRAEAAPVLLASAAGPGAIVPAADLWLDVVNEWTRTLREAPPDDPARATARHLSSRARSGMSAVPLADAVSEVGGEAPAALATRFGPGPFLLVETTRWVLVGCFHEFTPWFNIRATLVDAGTGEVLWRDRCGGAYPAGARAHWPGALEADGKALYARLIADRAAGCAAALLASLERQTAAPAGGPGR